MPEDDQTDPTVREAYQTAQQALEKMNGLEERIQELQEDHEQLRDDVTALELRFSEQHEPRAVRGGDGDV